MERLRAGLHLLRSDLYELRFALLGIAAYYLVVHLMFGAFCPVVILTGFPCPGCGMTRALFLVLCGSFVEAFRLQPVIYGWLLLGVWFVWNRYGGNGKASKSMKSCLVFLILATQAIYVWRLFFGFPVQL